jgi:hypothetical protein
MVKIYRDSFAFFFAYLPALLVFAVMIEGLLWVLKPKSEGAVTFVVLVFIAYCIHRYFLFGEGLPLWKMQPAPNAPPMKFGWFLTASILAVLVPTGIALAIAFTWFDGDAAIGIFVILLFPLYLLSLSLFGTALPASVARDGTWQVAQGLRLTFATMWRLILGPGIVGAALLAATVFSSRALDSLQLAEDNLILLAYFILLRTAGFLTTTLAVAVLCHMYVRSRPDPAGGVVTG